MPPSAARLAGVSAAEDPIEKLVRQVRRRLLFAHCARSAVAAAFIAAAMVAAMLIVGALLPSLAVSAGMLLILTVVAVVTSSLIAAVRARPDDHQVAQHIDRTLELHELLASALVGSTADDGAARSLRAMAADVAARTRASDVSVRLPSLEAAAASILCFVGVLIAATLMPTASGGAEELVAASPSDARRLGASADIDSDTAAADTRRATPAAVQRRTRSPAAISDTVEAASPTHASSAELRSDALSDAGNARGSTSDSSAARLAFDAPLDPPAVAAGGHAPDAASAGSSDGSGDPIEAIAAGATAERRAVIALAGEISSAPNNSALAALIAGTVPARCRDLARAYFDVDPSSEPPQRSAGR